MMQVMHRLYQVICLVYQLAKRGFVLENASVLPKCQRMSEKTYVMWLLIGLPLRYS